MGATLNTTPTWATGHTTLKDGRHLHDGETETLTVVGGEVAMYPAQVDGQPPVVVVEGRPYTASDLSRFVQALVAHLRIIDPQAAAETVAKLIRERV